MKPELTWKEAKRTEYNRLKEIFNDYLSKSGCTDLLIMSEQYSPFDALVLSAVTKTLMIEYKNRDISSELYPDCMFEKIKYDRLKPYHEAGNEIIYMVEYQDKIFLWNISDIIYRKYKEFNYGDDYGFYMKRCMETTCGSSLNRVMKKITDCKFDDACIVIEKKK